MKLFSGKLGVVSLVLSLAGCGGGGGGGSAAAPPVAPPPPPPPPPVPSFADVTQASNVVLTVGITRPSPIAFPEILVAESTFGGIASGDCDLDGDTDLFVTYGDNDNGNGPGGPNRLYLNQLAESGDGLSFVDTAQAGGVANTRPGGLSNDRHSGPVFADMDGDEDPDLFIGGIYGDPNKIYENVGVGSCTFTDVTANSPGIQNMLAAQTISAAFGDYDLDGDLDMFLTHWGTRDDTYGVPRSIETEHLWENVSDSSGIRFVNASAASDVSNLLWVTRAWGAAGTQDVDFTFTPTFARIDADLWPDLLLASDFETSQALVNNGNGTFRDLGNPLLRDVQNGMGSAVGDIDFDGDLDWFVTSIFNPDAIGNVPVWGNRLFRNDADSLAGWFIDITDLRGVADGEWGWGACFLDIDNDTDLDLYQTNGWDLLDDRAQNHDFSIDRSRVFLAAANGSFVESAASVGLDDDLDARSIVCADFDHDGDTDIFLLSRGLPNSAVVWENTDAAAGRNFLRVRLLGLAPNTEAVGARIFLTAGGRTQMREVTIGGNFAAQHPTVQVFGLGLAAAVDELRIEWPALVPGPGMAPVQPVTVIDDPTDPRLQPSALGGTLEIAHPDR